MSYREWVGPPPSWWVLSVLFSLSWLVAIGFYLGPLAGALGLLGAQAVVTGVLLGTAVRLRLDGTELTVGRAVLDLAYVSAVRGLDVEATRDPDRSWRRRPGPPGAAALRARPRSS